MVKVKALCQSLRVFLHSIIQIYHHKQDELFDNEPTQSKGIINIWMIPFGINDGLTQAAGTCDFVARLLIPPDFGDVESVEDRRRDLVSMLINVKQ